MIREVLHFPTPEGFLMKVFMFLSQSLVPDSRGT